MRAYFVSIKEHMMKYRWTALLVWMYGIGMGAFSYLNTPHFLDIDIFLKIPDWIVRTGELAWSLVVVFLTGAVALLAQKVVAFWWEERVKPVFAKWFKKKRRK
jgi:hypothetical protein